MDNEKIERLTYLRQSEVFILLTELLAWEEMVKEFKSHFGERQKREKEKLQG